MFTTTKCFSSKNSLQRIIINSVDKILLDLVQLLVVGPLNSLLGKVDVVGVQELELLLLVVVPGLLLLLEGDLSGVQGKSNGRKRDMDVLMNENSSLYLLLLSYLPRKLTTRTPPKPMMANRGIRE